MFCFRMASAICFVFKFSPEQCQSQQDQQKSRNDKVICSEYQKGCGRCQYSDDLADVIADKSLFFLLSWSHWFMKMVTNMAVITKSSPFVLKVMKLPARAPRAAPPTQ